MTDRLSRIVYHSIVQVPCATDGAGPLQYEHLIEASLWSNAALLHTSVPPHFLASASLPISARIWQLQLPLPNSLTVSSDAAPALPLVLPPTVSSTPLHASPLAAKAHAHDAELDARRQQCAAPVAAAAASCTVFYGHSARVWDGYLDEKVGGVAVFLSYVHHRVMVSLMHEVLA